MRTIYRESRLCQIDDMWWDFKFGWENFHDACLPDEWQQKKEIRLASDKSDTLRLFRKKESNLPNLFRLFTFCTKCFLFYTKIYDLCRIFGNEQNEPIKTYYTSLTSGTINITYYEEVSDTFNILHFYFHFTT